MRTFGVLVVVALCLTLSLADDDATNKDFQDCKKETNPSDADIMALKDKKVPNTKEGRCMLNCMMKKMKMITDGKINVEGFVEMMKNMMPQPKPEEIEKVEKSAMQCSKEVTYGTDECDNAAAISNCFMDKTKEMGMKPNEGKAQ